MSEENVQEVVVPEVPVEAPVETLDESDKVQLKMLSLQIEVAKATAEKAIAAHDLVQMQYRYLVLETYMKYGLTQKDSIDPSGVIKRAVTES